jgi:hypothetical protein
MKTKQNQPKMSKKERTRKWIARIFALLLALLMVGGTFYYIIIAIASMVS